MEITIEPADFGDIPVLVEFMREYYAHDKLPFEEAPALSALSDLLANQDLGRIWLIWTDNLPIGYIVLTFGYSLEFQGRDAFIDELYLERLYRGSGIGTQILQFVTSEAKSLGIKAIHLEVERENQRAQQFYRSVGFESREATQGSGQRRSSLKPLA